MIGIYGASGFGREIMPFARSPAVFIDDAMAGMTIGQHAVVSFAQFCALEGAEKSVAIAIADPATRRRLADRCDLAGIAQRSIFADEFRQGERCRIAPGAIFCPFSHVTCDLVIGRHFHANIYSYVAHDCEIGDFVTFAPAVRCNGNVVIEDEVYVGTGAILRQGTKDKKLRIGKGAVIGAGAVVLTDVAPGTTVVGNPARVLAR